MSTSGDEMQQFCTIKKTVYYLTVLVAILGLLYVGFNVDIVGLPSITLTSNPLIGSIISSDAVNKTETIILFWTFNYYSKLLNLDESDLVSFDCGEYTCGITKNKTYLLESDVVIFNPRFSRKRNMPSFRKPWQRWALQTRESPLNERIGRFFQWQNKLDSDISSPI